MKRGVHTIILFVVFSIAAKASHITGGEMYYTFIGVSNGMYQYSVTLKLFQRCNSGRQFPNPAIISIFDKSSNTRMSDIAVSISNTTNISLSNNNPCITNPPVVCYDVAYYNFTVSLPASSGGYVMASQVNYRIAGINNLSPGYNNVGATYTAEIPGNASGLTVPQNNSATFTGSDLVVVCANNNFNYSFAAQDGNEINYVTLFAMRMQVQVPVAAVLLLPTLPLFPLFHIVGLDLPAICLSAIQYLLILLPE